MRFMWVFLLVFSSSCFAADPEASPTAAPTEAAAAQPPTPSAAPLPDVSATTAFTNGVTAFQKNELPSARDWFRASLAKDPSQVVAWYDLGLSEQHLGNKGLAMAYFRRALVLMPGFQPAQSALAFTKKTLEKSEIPHEVETWESLRTVLLAASIYQFAILTLVLLFVTGWLALVYIGSRRRAILDEKPLPAFPAPATFAALLFVIFLSLSICKIIDDQDLRATVVVKKIEVKALPDASSTALFELFEGLEVIAQQTRQAWIQVTYPGGPTGWIPRSALFTDTDRIAP